MAFLLQKLRAEKPGELWGAEHPCLHQTHVKPTSAENQQVLGYQIIDVTKAVKEDWLLE